MKLIPKKLTLLACLAMLTGCFFTACQQSDEPDSSNHKQTVWGSSWWFKGLDSLHPDSIVSADAHEITFYSPERWPISWESAKWVMTCWEYNDADINYYPQFGRGEWIMKDFIKEDKLVYNDWISFELVVESKYEYKVNVKVQPNNTGAERRALFSIIHYENCECVPNIFSENSIFLIVTQKPVIDTTPFEIKARYKNKTYTTQAHLDDVENLIFEDTEFSKMMEMLQKRKDIECVILEDDVVDYFDKEDMKSNPILNAINIHAENRDDKELTRANCPTHSENLNNGFDFMTSDALSYFGIFDGVNFKDTNFTKNLTGQYSAFDLEYINDAKLDNKTSSIALAYEAKDNDVCAVLTLYDQGGYSKGGIISDDMFYRMYMIATPSHPHVWHSDLKKVPCLNTSKSWNDRISSCSFHFGILGN